MRVVRAWGQVGMALLYGCWAVDVTPDQPYVPRAAARPSWAGAARAHSHLLLMVAPGGELGVRPPARGPAPGRG